MAKKRTSPSPLLRLLTHPGIMVYGLPALMALLVAGTVSQRYIGLYESERLFFSSFILWVGLVPLPGAYTLLAIISASLCAKLLIDSPWSYAKAGTIITHIGALLLLGGGLLTALTAEEGYIMLKPGEDAAIVSDYHTRELAVLKNGEKVHQVKFPQLREGEIIAPEGLPFTVKIAALCRNCAPMPWQQKPKKLHGLAKNGTLVAAPLSGEDEENRTGAMLEISGAGKADGTYLTLESIGEQPSFTLGTDRYTVLMRRRGRTLPFSVRLDTFTKDTHPGTEIASRYESAITVTANGLAWPFTIRMNHPLRYQGYTLYQSSFVTTDEGEFSVLAVVKNQGRVFPYVSSLVMCAGLVMHLIVRRKGKRK